MARNPLHPLKSRSTPLSFHLLPNPPPSLSKYISDRPWIDIGEKTRPILVFMCARVHVYLCLRVKPPRLALIQSAPIAS